MCSSSEKCLRVMRETRNKWDPTGLHNRLLIRSRATPSASPIAELALISSMFLAAPSQCGEIEGAGLQGSQVAGRPVEVSLPASAEHCLPQPSAREQSEAARGCPIKKSKDEV